MSIAGWPGRLPIFTDIRPAPLILAIQAKFFLEQTRLYSIFDTGDLAGMSCGV
jgi:hypothetical protein